MVPHRECMLCYVITSVQSSNTVQEKSKDRNYKTISVDGGSPAEGVPVPAGGGVGGGPAGNVSGAGEGQAGDELKQSVRKVKW